MDQMLTATVEESTKEDVLGSVLVTLPLLPVQWELGTAPYLNGDKPHTTTSDQVEDQEDPGYGWRYVEKIMADGQVKGEIIPLTLEDLLHPEEDDEVFIKPPHARNTAYLSTVLGTHLKDDLAAFVSDDLLIDLNIPGIRPVAPDIAVLFNIAEKKAWGVLDTQKENSMPSTAFEITSPSTRDQDFNKKRDYYARAEIPFYVILDIQYDSRDRDRVRGYILHAYELIAGRYVDMQPDVQGRYWLPPLGLYVGIGDDGILCYDAQRNLLKDHSQMAEALADSEQYAAEQERLAQQEAERAAKQERIAQQETERATAQERIAQQEAERADEQEQIAQQEAERATAQERIAQQETERATAQERIAQQEAERAKQGAERADEQEQIAQQEAERAKQEAERATAQEQIAKQEAERADEQERIAQQEAERATAQEQIAKQEAERAKVSEEENARLRALLAQLGGEL